MNDSLFKQAIHVPRLKPAARDTWELQGSLLGTTEISDVVKLDFPGPCRIVGAYPSITLNDATGFLVPTPDDIAINLQFNEKRKYTAQIGQTTQAQRGQGYVTLAAMSTLNRDLEIEVLNARPTMTVQYRWKRWTGAQLYRDVLVSLAFFVEVENP